MYKPRIDLEIPEISKLYRSGFGRRMGFGLRPILLIIDVQNYMLGAEGRDDQYPSSCGDSGRNALIVISKILNECRNLSIPIVYTKFIIDSPHDMGVYGLKREFRETENWCLRNTYGSEIPELIKPVKGDLVLEKKKPSAFFGTPLLSYLIFKGIDTIIITGGATSNCVRATVMDASSLNFRTLVISDAVFDRIKVSHEISLFDIDRQFGDVLTSEQLINELKGRLKSNVVSNP